MKLTVLMSTYNGKEYLEEQLTSLYNQKFDGELFILVRDDGSTDGTQEILKKAAKEHKNLSWYQGENVKPAKSFWDLLKKAKGSDYYAFCDQDDVWDEDKLQIAVNHLKELPQDNPLLYFSDVRTVDKDLKPISETMVAKDIPIDYPKSLMNNIAPGCTYVFNEASRYLASQFDENKHFMHIHDWKMYQICVCFGHVFFDLTTHMSYRQHGNNTIGAVKGKIRYYLSVIKKRNDPKFVLLRKKEALALEEVYGTKMSEVNRHITYLMAHYDEDKAARKELLKDPRFKYSRKQYLYFKHRIKIKKL